MMYSICVCLFVAKYLFRTDIIFPDSEASHRSTECLLFCGRVLPPSQEKSSLEKKVHPQKKIVLEFKVEVRH